MSIVMIDPGHYGFDSGAVGPAGTKEADVAYAIALKVAEILDRHGHSAPLSTIFRRDLPSLDQDLTFRANAANKLPADLFVSIHCNGHNNRTAHGMEVWTAPGQGQGDKLADCIMDELTKEFPELWLRTDMSDGDRDKEARFAVLVRTNMPAVLVETAFITNPAEEALLASSDGQDRFALAIAKGILSHLGTAYQPPISKALAELHAAGVINSLDYWVKSAVKGGMCKGEYVAALLQNMADHIRR